MLNISVTILDPEADGKYVPLAKDQCRKFAREFAGIYISRTFLLGTATILMEVWTPTQARITIRSTAPYMESGIQDLLSFMAGEESTYLAAKVMFTPRVAALTAKRTQYVMNASGRRVTSGSESWSGAGGKEGEKLKAISASIGTQGNTKDFEKKDPTYFEPSKILRHKLMRERFPPSLFTGKLHLYVQALYGSDRDDYRQSIYDRFEVNTGGFTMWEGPEPNPEFTPRPIFAELTYGYPTTGLFTVGNGTYLMVHIGIDGVTYREMTPRKSAQPRSDEHEAHLLVDLVPSATVKTATGTGVGAGAGSPLYYGWHFNESGSEAAVVLYQSLTIAGVRKYDFSPNTAEGVRFTLYRMALSYDAKKKQLSFAITAGESGLHLPAIQTKIYFPSTGRGGMQLFFTEPTNTLNCWAELGPAPAYCYYRENTLEVVRVWNGSFSAVAEYSRGREGLTDYSDGAQVSGSLTVATASRTIARFPASTLDGSSGVASSEFDYSGGGRLSPGQVIHDRIILAAGSTSYSSVPDPPGSNEGRKIVFVIKLDNEFATQYNLAIKTDESDSHVAVLVIPFGNASAVIAGGQIKVVGTFTTKIEYRMGNNIVLMSDWFEQYPNSPPLWSGIGGGILLWSPRDGETNPKYRPVPAGPNSVNSSMALYCAAGAIPLSSYSNSSMDSGEGFADRPYQALYEPSFNSVPAYGPLMRVSTSYFGAVRHDACFNDGPTSGYAGGWPEGADTPAGWA